jgi:NAD(P) transhydrogenase subunit beta
MSAFHTTVRLVYVAAAVCFVLGLHLMNSPVTARRGNRLSALGMAAALAATAALVVDTGGITTGAWIAVGSGLLIGSAVGLHTARTVRMTAMPQLVSLFNAVGGGAAALIAVEEFARHTEGTDMHWGTALAVVLDVLIGAVTFSGSLIASGKLQGLVPSRPVVFPGARPIGVVLALGMLAGSGYLLVTPGSVPAMVALAVAALAFGVALVMPIGGADMPVVISLLNAFTGTAVAMAGFVIGNAVMVIAGALVGASGWILTRLMAAAMNRSIGSIVLGGFGTGDAGPAELAGTAGASVRSVGADDAAVQLAYARKVVIVPGYGLAAAHAQHEVHELTRLLEENGVVVDYAIHPVAGRMPGHMNVLLAEADVPYPQLREMDEINPEFPQVDVALVVGANDVTNPAARRPGTAISGMPILDVDRARNVIVVKRSMGQGYAGIDNELYSDPRTGMYFGDAKTALAELAAAVKALLG